MHGQQLYVASMPRGPQKVIVESIEIESAAMMTATWSITPNWPFCGRYTRIKHACHPAPIRQLRDSVTVGCLANPVTLCDS